MRTFLYALLLLLPVVAGAQYMKATLVYEDGTVRTGFAEEPEGGGPVKIRFKETEKGKPEKLKPDDLHEIKLVNEYRTEKRYLSVYVVNMKGLHDDMPDVHTKVWAFVEKSGKLNLLSSYFNIAPIRKDSRPGEGTMYMVNIEGTDTATYVYCNLYLDGFKVSNAVTLKRNLRLCSDDETWIQFVESINNKEIEAKGLKHLVDLYNGYEPVTKSDGLKIEKL